MERPSEVVGGGAAAGRPGATAVVTLRLRIGRRAAPFHTRRRHPCIRQGIERIATAATDLYRSVPEPRGREVDIAIAAHAIVRDVPVWTLNIADFEDLPGVRLFAP